MRYSDFLEVLSHHPGIIHAELLTDEVANEICYLEYNYDNVGFAPNYSLGLIDIFEKDLKMILFCDQNFEMFTEPFLDIIDTQGHIIGHDVMDSELNNYNSNSYVWLTDNVFCDMNAMGGNQLRCVMRSLKLNIDGISDSMSPRVFYPCSATADYLNDLFCYSDKASATVLIGIDGIEL